MPPADLYQYHKSGKYPGHGKAILALLLVFALYFGTGIYALMKLWEQYGAAIMAFIQSIGIPQISSSTVITLSVIVGGYIFFSLVLALGAAALAKKLGGTLIIIGAFMMLIITWAPVVLLLYSSGWNFSVLSSAWPIMIPGGFILLLTVLMMTVFKERLVRAGKIIELTGEVCLKEKGVFIPPIVSMFFTFISSMIFAGIVMYFMYPNGITSDPVMTDEATVMVIINFVIYTFLTLFVFKFAYATSSAITYIYIRGRNPSLGDGFRGALGAVAAIAILSVMGVIVKIVQMILRAITRKSGAGGRTVGDAAAGAIGWIWALINYFTIPAIVAEDLSATKGIKRSINMVRKNFVDVIIKETGVRWGFGVLAMIILFGMGIAGAFIGWLQTADTIMALLYGIVFVFLGGLPVTIVLRTFDIVYVTILYVFIRTKEGDFSKTAIPSPVKSTLNNAYSSAKKK